MWTRTINFAWVVGIGSIITIIVFIYIFFTKLKLTKELKPQCEEDVPFVNQPADLIDKTGTALTDIRPVGKAKSQYRG